MSQSNEDQTESGTNEEQASSAAALPHHVHHVAAAAPGAPSALQNEVIQRMMMEQMVLEQMMHPSSLNTAAVANPVLLGYLQQQQQLNLLMAAGVSLPSGIIGGIPPHALLQQPVLDPATMGLLASQQHPNGHLLVAQSVQAQEMQQRQHAMMMQIQGGAAHQQHQHQQISAMALTQGMPQPVAVRTNQAQEEEEEEEAKSDAVQEEIMEEKTKRNQRLRNKALVVPTIGEQQTQKKKTQDPIEEKVHHKANEPAVIEKAIQIAPLAPTVGESLKEMREQAGVVGAWNSTIEELGSGMSSRNDNVKQRKGDTKKRATNNIIDRNEQIEQAVGELSALSSSLTTVGEQTSGTPVVNKSDQQQKQDESMEDEHYQSNERQHQQAVGERSDSGDITKEAHDVTSLVEPRGTQNQEDAEPEDVPVEEGATSSTEKQDEIGAAPAKANVGSSEINGDQVEDESPAKKTDISAEIAEFESSTESLASTIDEKVVNKAKRKPKQSVTKKRRATSSRSTRSSKRRATAPGAPTNIVSEQTKLAPQFTVAGDDSATETEEEDNVGEHAAAKDSGSHRQVPILTRIKRAFTGPDESWHFGTVTKVSAFDIIPSNNEEKEPCPNGELLYGIKYDDGDEEEVEETELKNSKTCRILRQDLVIARAIPGGQKDKDESEDEEEFTRNPRVRQQIPIFARVTRFFPGQGWYDGTITKIRSFNVSPPDKDSAEEDDGGNNNQLCPDGDLIYWIDYDDGDKEELEEREMGNRKFIKVIHLPK